MQWASKTIHDNLPTDTSQSEKRPMNDTSSQVQQPPNSKGKKTGESVIAHLTNNKDLT